MSAVFGTLDSSGNLQLATNVGENLQSGWSAPASTDNQAYLKITSPSGTDIFVNKETGEIRE